jgi:hypothetical protein
VVRALYIARAQGWGSPKPVISQESDLESLRNVKQPPVNFKVTFGALSAFSFAFLLSQHITGHSIN